MTTSNWQLMAHLGKYAPRFNGVFSSDDVAGRRLDPGHAIIINFQPSSMRGSHWVCAIRPKGFPPIYIDPFGFPPPKSIDSFLGKNYLYNTRQYQELTSEQCGKFCYYFLKKFLEGEDIRKVLGSGLTVRPSLKNELLISKTFSK